jgi:large subunit ribosomal protein L9
MGTMRVMLMETIDHLGEMGQVVSVKRGYARNYLLPRGEAVVATRGNLRQMEHYKRIVAEKIKRVRLESEDLAKNLGAQELEFIVKVGESGHLYGAVTTMDIARQLEERGFGVDRRKINLDEPIKTPGDYTATVKLPQGIVAEIKVSVKPEEDSVAVDEAGAATEVETAESEAAAG